MKVSNRFTLARALFAPVFFILFNLPNWVQSQSLSVFSAYIMIPLFVLFQITDYFDGHYARKYNEVSDFGKIFDPFADVILNLTVFMCAVTAGYMPSIIFMLILYREFTQSFLRMAALKKGIAIAARKGGKVKTVSYIISGILFLLIESFSRLDFSGLSPELKKSLISNCKTILLILFIICVLLSWGSFLDYMKSFYSKIKDND
ncbi:MAG: CDP-diacylglycerol--glycerol-3-phosphate 3-phosphatidyltransferase [Treponema sp.]|nr:CDP-diacylglycerol--glycerol-3-phosphate 3-phosphatidyltransferase [Treponema sp.]